MTRHALVTGGGTGLGLAITRRLVTDGLTVTIAGRRQDVLDSAADELGPAVTTHAADVTDPDAVAGLADALPDHVDVLVLNAGGTAPTTGDSLAALADDWTTDFRSNVLSAVLVTEALLPGCLGPAAGSWPCPRSLRSAARGRTARRRARSTSG